MSEDIRRVVKLIEDKQLLGELRVFRHEFMGRVTISLSGTITPIQIVSSNDFAKTDLFEMTGPSPVAMINRISLPSYKVLAPNLWCPALRQEIIACLEWLKTNYRYLDQYLDQDITKPAIAYIIRRRHKESKRLTLPLPNGATLIGELALSDFFRDIRVLGNIALPNGEKTTLCFYEVENFFIDWPSKQRADKRMNQELWNNKLADLIIALLTEIKDFTQCAGAVEKSIQFLTRNSDRAKFCNQLHKQLLRADQETLRQPATLQAFRALAEVGGFNLNLELLV